LRRAVRSLKNGAELALLGVVFIIGVVGVAVLLGLNPFPFNHPVALPLIVLLGFVLGAAGLMED